MRRYALALLCCFVLPLTGLAETPVRLGYFEAGEDPLSFVLRDEIQRQLDNIAPPDTAFVFAPEGYRSASWMRDSSRIKAAELARVNSVDIMVAVGPWAVQDLLAAGYRKPILGIRQIDLLGAGLVHADGTPIAPNLTLHEMPGKIEDDIGVFSRLAPIKKLGVLWFDTGNPEQDSILARIDRVGRRLGFATVSADGYNLHGSYAFFKALNALPADIDALYVGPLWGMTITETNEFLRSVAARGIPLLVWDGKFLVSRGAFATNYAYGLVSEAHFQAVKLLRLARGENPSDLPVIYRGGSSLALNIATARQIGLEVPTEALLAGEVIGDPIARPGEPYSLVDAVGRALQSNPGYLAAYDAIEAATRDARAAGARYWPSLALDARAGWVDDHTRNNTVEPIANNQYRASLVLDQPIFSLELLRSRRVAAAQTRIAEADRQQARLDLELAVTTAYLGHLRALEDVAVERRYRELVERTLEFVAADYNLRRLREADLLRWQDERQTVITRVTDAENAVTTSRTLLNLLFNLPPDQPVSLDSTLASNRVMGLHYDLLSPLAVRPSERSRFESWLAEQTRSHNASLARASAGRDLGLARFDAGKARRWPALSLRAAFNLVDEVDDNLGIIDEESDTWSVFGRLRMPILGLDGHHERARLRAELSEAEYRRDDALLAVFADLRRGTGNLLARLIAWPRAGRSVEFALQSMRLIIDDYESERRDLAALIDAYYHARDIELAEIASRYEYQVALARLVRDVGWAPSQSFRTYAEEFVTRAREVLGQ